MQVETLKDVLERTRKEHQYLSNCLHDCADNSEIEPTRKWLDYLSEYEAKIAKRIDKLSEKASENVLKTWCYEYLDKVPLEQQNINQNLLSDLTPENVVEMTIEQHQQIIELYRNLYSRNGAPSVRKFLKKLIELEDHQPLIEAKHNWH